MTDNTMKKLKVALLSGVFAAGAFAAPAAHAEGLEGIELSANVALVSDYRFRGLSLSDEDMALQGGFDLSHESGFYGGIWGSSIETFGGSELEVDYYVGYSNEVEGFTYDVGILAYVYPGSDNEYFEAYASVGGSIEAIDWTLGAAYAFEEEDTGDMDNTYVYVDLSTPIAETGLTANAHLGFEDGAFGDEKLDWLIGVSYDFEQFSLGVSYVDTDQDGDGLDAGVIVSLGASF